MFLFLQMLMKKTDQQIFRQLLSNYETIGQISDHVTVSPETPSPLPPSPLPPSPPPFPVTPRSTPSSPEKRRSYSTTPGDTELLRIIREALDQPGPLNIRNIVTQLSPIRRRRSSEPTTIEYEDLPPGFGEDDEQELEGTCMCWSFLFLPLSPSAVCLSLPASLH